jgi:hypothetical protein
MLLTVAISLHKLARRSEQEQASMGFECFKGNENIN